MALSALSGDEQGVILGQLRDTLEPRLEVPELDRQYDDQESCAYVEVGAVVHAKYEAHSHYFKPAKVVSVDPVGATCDLQFFGFTDVADSIPLTIDRVRPPASAKEREDSKLLRLIYGEVRAAAVHCKGGILIISLSLSLCARAQAIIIRDEISEITGGKIEYFPDAPELEKAREDICAVIHAKSPFQPKTSKEDCVEI